MKLTFGPQAEAAFIYDAVTVFAKAFGEDVNFINDFRIVPTTCQGYKISGYEPSSSGKDILEKVDAVNRNIFNSTIKWTKEPSM